jgi:DNA-binding transcriptional ArsR family regulator
MSQPAPRGDSASKRATGFGLLSALSNRTRMDVLFHLAKAEMCVTEIAEHLELEASAVSLALKKLQAVDLVEFEIVKKKHVYRLAPSVQAFEKDGVAQIHVRTKQVELFLMQPDR